MDEIVSEITNLEPFLHRGFHDSVTLMESAVQISKWAGFYQRILANRQLKAVDIADKGQFCDSIFLQIFTKSTNSNKNP